MDASVFGGMCEEQNGNGGQECCNIDFCTMNDDEFVKKELVNQWVRLKKLIRERGKKEGDYARNCTKTALFPHLMMDCMALGDKKLKVLELEINDAYLYTHSIIECRPDQPVCEDNINTAFARIKFEGCGVMDISVDAETPIRIVIVKVIQGEESNILIKSASSDESGSIHVHLTDKQLCSGKNTYVLTIATQNGCPANIGFRISQNIDIAVNKKGGVWVMHENTATPESLQVGVTAKDIDELQCRWYVEKDDIDEILSIMQKWVDNTEEGIIAKILSPSNLTGAALTVLIGVAVESTGIGIAAGILGAVVFSFFPGWNEPGRKVLERLKSEIIETAEANNFYNTQFKKSIKIDIGLRYTLDPAGGGIMPLIKVKPFFATSVWDDNESGLLTGPEGYIGTDPLAKTNGDLLDSEQTKRWFMTPEESDDPGNDRFKALTDAGQMEKILNRIL